MNKKKLLLILGVIILTTSASAFVIFQNSRKVNTALIGQAIPEFSQADLQDSNLIRSNKDLPKQAHLINVWASWCTYCKREHPFLLTLAEQGVPIIGITYRDKRGNALKYLQQSGNPFIFNIDDSQGKLIKSLEVHGTPQTYIVDKNGIIRYHYAGGFDAQAVEQIILPELHKLNSP